MIEPLDTVFKSLPVFKILYNVVILGVGGGGIKGLSGNGK